MAPFTVCDAAHEPPVVTTDPTRRPRVAADQITVGGPFGPVVNVEVNDPPVPVTFLISVRLPDGRELRCGQPLACLPQSSTSGDRIVPGSPGDAEAADVVFRPDPDLARDDLDATPIWGEPVVVHGVPFAHP